MTLRRDARRPYLTAARRGEGRGERLSLNGGVASGQRRDSGGRA